VTLVDFNEASLSVAAKNVKKNGLVQRCSLVHSETNRYLYSRFDRDEKFDAVDVDPFGTPLPICRPLSSPRRTVGSSLSRPRMPPFFAESILRSL